MDATPLPPSPPIPFRIAQAYGLRSGVAAPRAVEAAAPAHIARVNAQDRVVLTARSEEAAAMRARVGTLVAARVEGGVDFLAQGVRAAPGSLSLYRHPAEKNSAATGVELGNGLDVRG